MTKEMEALADKICKEELGQEPNETNLAFRKTLVHGMVRWNEESKVKNLSSNSMLSDSLLAFSKWWNEKHTNWLRHIDEDEIRSYLASNVR